MARQKDRRDAMPGVLLLLSAEQAERLVVLPHLPFGGTQQS